MNVRLRYFFSPLYRQSFLSYISFHESQNVVGGGTRSALPLPFALPLPTRVPLGDALRAPPSRLAESSPGARIDLRSTFPPNQESARLQESMSPNRPEVNSSGSPGIISGCEHVRYNQKSLRCQKPLAKSLGEVSRKFFLETFLALKGRRVLFVANEGCERVEQEQPLRLRAFTAAADLLRFVPVQQHCKKRRGHR